MTDEVPKKRIDGRNRSRKASQTPEQNTPAPKRTQTRKTTNNESLTPENLKTTPKKAPVKRVQNGARKATVKNKDSVEDQKIHTREELEALYETLSERHKVFIESYLLELNASQAAIKAGYVNNCYSISSILRNKFPIKQIIDARLEERLERMRMTREQVMERIENITIADPNDLVENRRVCCRHCWGGEEFKYMETPAEKRKRQKAYQEKVRKAEAEGAEIPMDDDDEYVLGYNGTKDPNPDCPECWGEGVERVIFKDTRKLNPAARALLKGVKIGKDGKEIMVHDQMKPVEMLAKHHKIYEDKAAEVTINLDAETLNSKFAEKMAQAQARQMEVLKERTSE